MRTAWLVISILKKVSALQAILNTDEIDAEMGKRSAQQGLLRAKSMNELVMDQSISVARHDYIKC